MLQTKAIQDCVTNHLGERLKSVTWLTGILGENPSKYAKSPAIWNPVLRELGLDAVYCPFDVESGQLASFVEAVRQDERVKGFSVTVPYKVGILPFLDDLDEKARRIGAVNVVVRRPDGRLVGANTDGSGGLASLTTQLPGAAEAFLAELEGTDVLLIGAGGAGKALAWYLAEAIGSGQLYLANRSQTTGKALCGALQAVYPNVHWVEERAIAAIATQVDLIINTTTKGQAGLRTAPDGSVTCLEPYSSLAEANPAALPSAMTEDPCRFYERWYRLSLPDLLQNLTRSAQLMATIPLQVVFFDVIYAPLESTLLRQARLSGHRTLNGKGMNICQAADALFHWVFRDHFEATGRYVPLMYSWIVERMAAAW